MSKKAKKGRTIYEAAAVRRKRPLFKSTADLRASLKKPAADKKKAAPIPATPAAPAKKKAAAKSKARIRLDRHGIDVMDTRGGFGIPFTAHKDEDLRDAAKRVLGQPTRKPSQIKVGKRFRVDKGDLRALARSIDDRGALLEPIVIDKNDKLIDGERRLAAWSMTKFAGKPIPVHVVDIDSIVAGEYDANAQRKDFNPSEAVAIKRALEPLLKQQAKDRQREHGGTTHGRKAAEGSAGGRAVDHVARIVGKDRRTLEKAEAIVAAAEAEPERFGKLKSDMDRTGRVNGPHKRLQVMKQTEQIRQAPPGVPMKGPYGGVSIDFPWPNEPGMTQEELDARGRSLRPYPAMSIKAGCAFMKSKVRPILAKDCVVYFWTTNFHMPYAFHLLQALGFKQHSTIGTWRKDKMGRGQVLRDKTEHCIIAIKGKPVINLTNQTTDWAGEGWERRENSRKPDAFYDTVEQLSPAPRYAEIFSRGGRSSLWDCHGDEIGKYPPITEPLPLPAPEDAPHPAQKRKRKAGAKLSPSAGVKILPEIKEPSPDAPLVHVDATHRVAEDFVTVSEQQAIACRERLKDLAVRMNGRHVVSMTIDHVTDENVGSCDCGQVFQFPTSDLHKQLDLAIEQHWLIELLAEEQPALDLGEPAAPAAVADDDDPLAIPKFLRRQESPAPAADEGHTASLVNPKLLPSSREISAIADRAEERGQ